MVTVEKIQEEIKLLPKLEYSRLLKWIHDIDDEKWDIQTERDIKSGKLDFLLEEETNYLGKYELNGIFDNENLRDVAYD